MFFLSPIVLFLPFLPFLYFRSKQNRALTIQSSPTTPLLSDPALPYSLPDRPGRIAPPPTSLPPRLHTAHTSAADHRRRRTHRCRGRRRRTSITTTPATICSSDVPARLQGCSAALPQCHACGGDSAAARRPPVSSFPFDLFGGRRP